MCTFKLYENATKNDYVSSVFKKVSLLYVSFYNFNSHDRFAYVCIEGAMLKCPFAQLYAEEQFQGYAISLVAVIFHILITARLSLPHLQFMPIYPEYLAKYEVYLLTV